MKWLERLNALGFQSYAEYQKGEHWITFRETYFKTHSKICCHCRNDRRIGLHHITYDRLGAELETDVVPLCWGCHRRTHELIKEGKCWLNEAHLHLDGSLPCRKPKAKRNKTKKITSQCKKLSKKERRKLREKRNLELQISLHKIQLPSDSEKIFICRKCHLDVHIELLKKSKFRSFFHYICKCGWRSPVMPENEKKWRTWEKKLLISGELILKEVSSEDEKNIEHLRSIVRE